MSRPAAAYDGPIPSNFVWCGGQKLVLALSPGKRQLDGCARDVTASLRDRSAIKFVLESDRRIGRPDRVNVFSREPADMLCWLL